MNIAVEVENISVLIDHRVHALNDITLSFPEGETIGVIGPSGAGKTTLMKAIVGRANILKGEVRIFGKKAGATTLRSEVNYMTQGLSVYGDLSVKQNIQYFAKMSGMNRKKALFESNKILSEIDLEDKADELVNNLSGGQKQRASLAIALIGSPRLMVLDEPTVGLDPVLRDRLWSLFKDLAKNGTTVIISSHSMDEAERCDDLILLREGNVISHSSPKELKETTKSKTIEIAFLKLVGDSK